MYYFNDSFLPTDAVFESAGLFISASPWRHSERTLTSWELIIVLEGVLPIHLGDKQYELKPSDCLLLPPGIPHGGTRPTESSIRFLWVHFRLPVLQQRTEKDCQEFLRDTDHTLLLPRGVFPEPNNVRTAIHLLLRLSQTHSQPLYKNTMIACVLLEITEAVLNILRRNGLHAEDMQPVQDWIRIHATENLTLDQIAQYFKYNPSYLSRRFKEITGVSITGHIQQCRIDAARRLLQDSRMTVQEIAYAVGFNDPRYFARVFRKHEDISPMAYRKTFLQTHYNSR